jgi:ribosomal protein L27
VSRVHKDIMGTEVKVGQKVVYNRGGTLCPGEVVGVGNEIRVMLDRSLWDKFFRKWDRTTNKMVPDQPKPSRIKHGTTLLVL